MRFILLGGVIVVGGGGGGRVSDGSSGCGGSGRDGGSEYHSTCQHNFGYGH